MTIRFGDGVTVDTKGEWRMEWLKDGWYIIGHGMMWFSSEDQTEASKELEDLRLDKEE
jgi:hypothetical protein